MKNWKKASALLLMLSLTGIVLSGCEFHASFGIGSFIIGSGKARITVDSSSGNLEIR